MDVGAASHSGAGQTPGRWKGTEPADPRDLKASQAALQEIVTVAVQEPLDEQSLDEGRSEVYWHLHLIAVLLKPTSDSVRVGPPRSETDLDDLQRSIRPILVDLVALFGHAPNVMDIVEDDEIGTNIEQIRQLMDLHEQLVAALADYADVIEGADRGSARRSSARKSLMSVFRQFQNKIEFIVEGLSNWRR